ncbi:DEAD/DEAH box helicase [Ornatilinea apprima]|uniref:DEAD/DEAH box helicase n=1 Tax=Ornatilinea apprima TaxID=1134406 RepID=UPI0009EAA398|nr:AAA domain-containing protein [Ornatilinea apprima]
MTRFGKNVLSQFLRTQCDKQLLLSLYNPQELNHLNWPVPLTARPAVQILRDVGVEWEQAKMSDLENAFGSFSSPNYSGINGYLFANKANGRFGNQNLIDALQQHTILPIFVLQPEFTHVDLRTRFLQNIGVPSSVISLIPQFTSFRPDIILAQSSRVNDLEVLSNGDTQPIQPNDTRQGLLITDIKHAGEANSSYSSEVTLYAVLLSNWLELMNLDHDYYVSDQISLWTRAKEISSLAHLIATTTTASITEKLQAYMDDLEGVDYPIFFQTIDHFFKTDLARVLSAPNWNSLDWHVDSRCSNCDFLGYDRWLSAADRTILANHRNHYCVTAAEDCAHLSRVATITRGGRLTLQMSGITDIPSVANLPASSQVFDQHNALKADRNHLPHRAVALTSGAPSLAPNTTTVDFPRWVDLEIFISVNFDSGTGLLTAIGSEARFRQRTNGGQQIPVQRTWPAVSQTLLTATLTEERTTVFSFLSRLADIFAFAYDPDPQRGGPNAANTRTQLYFWDRRQFEELTKAIGRHLDYIVSSTNNRVLQGLIWLFPPEQTLQNNEITRANPITFMKNVVQANLRLPVPHCLTIFNVERVYHNQQYPAQNPGSFYYDPFSDMIPRERIYEIWSGEPLIQLGNTQVTRSQCIVSYGNTVESQVKAIRNIVWKFRSDMANRINLNAPSLSIGIPFNFQQMSEDGRLWYGWARLEEAVNAIELEHIWSAEPEQLEASYDILRFSTLLSVNNNDFIFSVRSSSQDCKFRDGEEFLALQDENMPGFLDLRIRDIVPQNIYSQLPHEDQNRRMHDIFKATLVSYDRNTLQAQVRLTNYGSTSALRQLLFNHNLVNVSTSASLVRGTGVSITERIRQCLLSIGRPPIAAAATPTYNALGHRPGTNLPRNDAITPAARVLWDAVSLSGQSTNITTSLIQGALSSITNSGWPVNSSQQATLTHCLGHKLSIVWGPPGTGKTTTAAALIVARILIAQATGETLRLLITGPTYTAWENLFNDVLNLLGNFQAQNIQCYRVYSSYHPVHAPLPPTTLPVFDTVSNSLDPNFNSMIQELDAPGGITLVGTVAHQCYRIADISKNTAQYPYFDFTVIDESSQLDVGKALFPLCLMAPNSDIIFFGDHLQMPPVVATQPPRGAEWLVGSIQTYLIERHHCSLQTLLVNYRSALPFVEYGHRIGYPHNLSAHSPNVRLHRQVSFLAQPQTWNGIVPWFSDLTQITEPNRHLTCITYQDGRAGQANDFEADLVCGIIQELFLSMSQGLDNELDQNGNPRLPNHIAYDPVSFWNRGIGIVTPHRAQRALIVRRLRQIFPTHSPTDIDSAVDTVERFQGGQRDTIIISFGVGDPDLISNEEEFLLQLERTNVAISRARAKCILVISDNLAYHLPSDRETLETSKAVKSYVSEFCRQTQQATIPTTNGTDRQIVVRWH